jgi:hypothetical protein
LEPLNVNPLVLNAQQLLKQRWLAEGQQKSLRA